MWVLSGYSVPLFLLNTYYKNYSKVTKNNIHIFIIYKGENRISLINFRGKEDI